MIYIGLTLLNGLAIAVRKLSLIYHRAYASNQAFAYEPFLIAQDFKAARPHLGSGNSRPNGDREAATVVWFTRPERTDGAEKRHSPGSVDGVLTLSARAIGHFRSALRGTGWEIAS